jgi:hypothetical protein
MRKIPMTTAVVAASLAAVAATVPTGSAAPHRAPHPPYKVVAMHLNNPRQLNFSKSGKLYVAEAGKGGSQACQQGPEAAMVCMGGTGSVTVVWKGKQHRVIKGLPSYADQGTGASALGPADVVPVGKHRLAVTIGYGFDPADRASLPAPGRWFGRLIRENLRNHHRSTLGDLAAFEGKANPIHDPNSDPTGLAKWGRSWVATDSGGNDLVKVHHHKVSALAVFRDQQTAAGKVQAVPTDVVVGPDGALYICELTGFPFVQGAANIYRMVPGHRPHVYASGLTNVTSLAFGPHGRLYAVQIANKGLLNGPTGSLWRVASDKSGGKTRNVSGPLFAPYGVAFKGHAAYVSTGAVAPGQGTVIKIPLT